MRGFCNSIHGSPDRDPDLATIRKVFNRFLGPFEKL